MSDQTAPAAARSPLTALRVFVAENIWLSIGMALLGTLALLSFGAPLFTAA